MNLRQRISLLDQLGQYMRADSTEWMDIKERASRENGWFTPEFVELACKQVADAFLQEQVLDEWTAAYQFPEENPAPKTVGIVMAGNIPLVGFHDLLCVFISGHIAMIKTSSKDKILLPHLVKKLAEWDNSISQLIVFAERLAGCDAYIATGSNNSAGYFDYYFRKYPNIIRRNRTSVAVLTGQESGAELEQLADDVYAYFGLGCRNVTKLYVPAGYGFEPLLNAFRKYNHLFNHHKYKNNYDYNLALHLLNNKYYMSNDSILLVEEKSVFSPISQLNYEYYTDPVALKETLTGNDDLQCVVGSAYTSFGNAQRPRIDDYADGVDTMAFLKGI
ncbi:acyl-CoA reductase [Terrimonas sp. NA20]|uniref:Acyl-CoA reductase n=1 Tax=Terrimonas ginsenosidimutans TaxID=2908004 RepID=A0ABS9KTK5_9BACT|nr:acyl-CoA reductase [Terrimonas ginsenosidimutans]MCG2615625.1 acyl-CoA reductase [Terrimonas ginsenosidimutans]